MPVILLGLSKERHKKVTRRIFHVEGVVQLLQFPAGLSNEITLYKLCRIDSTAKTFGLFSASAIKIAYLPLIENISLRREVRREEKTSRRSSHHFWTTCDT